MSPEAQSRFIIRLLLGSGHRCTGFREQTLYRTNYARKIYGKSKYVSKSYHYHRKICFYFVMLSCPTILTLFFFSHVVAV